MSIGLQSCHYYVRGKGCSLMHVKSEEDTDNWYGLGKVNQCTFSFSPSGNLLSGAFFLYSIVILVMKYEPESCNWESMCSINIQIGSYTFILDLRLIEVYGSRRARGKGKGESLLFLGNNFA
jgi:hypothetical protein